MSAALQRTISPVNGSVYVERPLAEPATIDAALDRAVTAQRAWRHTPLADRTAIVTRFVEHMESRADEFGAQLAWQMGRPIRYAPFEIRRGFAERARHMMEIAPGLLTDIAAAPKEGFRRFIRRDPVGLIFIVAPWNYRIETGTWFMNRCDYLDPELAWTGVKNTGHGCTLSVLGYEAFTRPKSFHLRLVTQP